MLSARPMSLKFHLFSFLSLNTLSRKHDVGMLFTWARLRSGLGPVLVYCTDCMPADDSGPVTLCGPVALYLMQ